MTVGQLGQRYQCTVTLDRRDVGVYAVLKKPRRTRVTRGRSHGQQRVSAS